MKKCTSCGAVLDTKTLAINEAKLIIDNIDLFKSSVRISYMCAYTCKQCHEVSTFTHNKYLSPKEMAFASEIIK